MEKQNYLLWKKKVAQTPLFNLFFLGLGWPWVGKFVGFYIIAIFMWDGSPPAGNLSYQMGGVETHQGWLYGLTTFSRVSNEDNLRVPPRRSQDGLAAL